MLGGHSVPVNCVPHQDLYASLFSNNAVLGLQPQYSVSYLNPLPETSTGQVLFFVFLFGCFFLSTSRCVLLGCASSKWLSVSLHWFHGGGDWSVNLLHDMFEIFIWGWAVRRCPTLSLLGSRGRQCCQKVIIFARYGSVLIFMDSRFYTLLGFAITGGLIETAKMLMQ